MTPVIKDKIRAMVSEANKHALVIEVDEGRNFAELARKSAGGISKYRGYTTYCNR